MTDDNKDLTDLVAFLKAAPHSEIDKFAVAKMETWSELPTSLEVLEVYDMCIYGALASPIAMTAISYLYSYLLKSENKVHDDNVPHAPWRNN